ncbi:class I SAM-dependent methyltransferase [Stieleria sp. TO1_6]|uniref:class I SAM-dependent methyltransferase n=1 Tax=Stieleria tagensis TaxID=2956795 RepID=UPI00209B235F|nr:class I SAM-dependent methyltransferase [Stieleria tagensis]MCO8120365.1 class I SAM-dependent methyltransferase [Stieleria tagensis]
MTTECLICRSASDSFAHAKIMGKYDIEYFRCRDCQFIQTETPYWLDEAYDDAIVSTDVGLISRNQRFARITDRMLRFVYPSAMRCVDYGGGYGMFTRMMRDRGHHFSHRDPYCENLFAAGNEAEPQASGFDFLTAFEVMEHLADPHADLQTLDSIADHWLVSTEVVPDSAPLPGQWWYYVLDGGQHISLWSRRSLQAIAWQYDRKLISYRGMHLFSRSNVSTFWATQILRDRTVRALDPLRKRRSLLQDDFQRAVASAG